MPSEPYKCDACGQLYSAKKDALACEDKHKIPVDIKVCTYLRDDTKNQYPAIILVSFSGNENVQYYREKSY